MLPVIQRRRGECTLGSEVASSLEGKMIEVTPCAIGRDDDLRMVGEIELNRVSIAPRCVRY